MATLFDDEGLDRPVREVIPGVVHLPGFLSLEESRALVEQARGLARQVAGTPTAMVRPEVGAGQMSVYILSLGYHWQTKPYRYVRSVDGARVPALPENYQGLVDRVLDRAAAVSDELSPWRGRMRAETALVNFYPPGSHMGMHVDGNEESGAPVVSLSIGQSALFRMGNPDNRGHPYRDVSLLSGDAIVFGGPARRNYHGIPAVQPGTTPEGCGLKDGRINITIREVDPH